MSARVCTPPIMLIDRMTPSVATPEAMGESSLPSSRTSHAEDEIMLFGRRFGSSGSERGSSPSSSSITNPQQITRIRNVSRNLFGPPNPNAAQYAREKLKAMLEEDSKRWNFDFEAEKPLPGRYLWEPVQTRVTTLSATHSTSSPGSTNPHPRPSSPPLSEPTQPKLRRIETTISPEEDALLIVRPVPVSSVVAVSMSGSTSSSQPQSSSTSIVSTISQTKSRPPAPPKPLFSPSTTPSFPSGQSQPSSHTSSIPPNVLVKTTAVDPLDGNQGGRKYLKNDSSSRRNTTKQVKLTVYGAPMKKRRIGQATPAAEKKAAF